MDFYFFRYLRTLVVVYARDGLHGVSVTMERYGLYGVLLLYSFAKDDGLDGHTYKD